VGSFGVGTVAAFLLAAVFVWLLLRRQKAVDPELNTKQGMAS